jgi:hypothetical protein
MGPGSVEVTVSWTVTGPFACGSVTAAVKPPLPRAGNVVEPLVEV